MAYEQALDTDSTKTGSSGVDLALPTSPSDHQANSDKENHDSFAPTLADRIKGRSRKAAVVVNQTPEVPTTTKIKQLLSKTPQKAQKPKRPAEEIVDRASARRRKVSKDEATEIPVYTNLPNSFASVTGGMRPMNDASDPIAVTPVSDDSRPVNDASGNRDFVDKVVQALKAKLKSRATCYGDRQNTRIHYLLTHASPASDEEMLYLSGPEAAAMFRPGVSHDGPILTEGQQPLPLQSVEGFLNEYYDDDTNVFIQDPNVKIGSQYFAKEVTIGQVKKRILDAETKGRPWNCLELATHVEDGLRPTFLSGEDTRLLTKLKLGHHTGRAGRRSYPQGYKGVEKWALLAEAGALTEPHQDSHGYSTYITVNQGMVGFGWLSYSTTEERKAWTKTGIIAGDRFRYVVLKPGQTVFFPAGTVHFVFRDSSAGHTLAFGGHVLRCSGIVHWAKTILEERSNPNITNEDLTSSAPGYLGKVEKFVVQAQKNGTMEKWGGAEAVEEFLRLKQEFMAK